MRALFLVVLAACGSSGSGGDDAPAPDASDIHDVVACIGWPAGQSECERGCQVRQPVNATCDYDYNGQPMACPADSVMTYGGAIGCCLADDLFGPIQWFACE